METVEGGCVGSGGGTSGSLLTTPTLLGSCPGGKGPVGEGPGSEGPGRKGLGGEGPGGEGCGTFGSFS